VGDELAVLDTPVEGDVRPREKVRLLTNGIDSVPFRLKNGAPVPNVKQDDSPRNKPKEVWDTKAHVFKLADPDELENYNRVMDLIGKGRAIHSFERMEWDDAAKNYVVFLRWIELYMELPK
jgi:hypothetical protein